MILVLCTTEDRPAIWAAHQLRRRLAVPVHLVSPQMLFAGAWEHRVGDGPPVTRIRVSDQLAIDSGEVTGVLNRISCLPETLFAKLPADDRRYAVQECAALYMSWIESLRCPVLNRPCAQGLCGALRPPEHWHALAARAGLPAGPGAGDACGIVIGKRWMGPQPESAPQFVRLACEARTPVLGIELGFDASGWRVTSAHPMPDLMDYGAPAIDALAETLAGGA